MLVHRAHISAAEQQAFENAILASGRDPRAFTAELFEASITGVHRRLRRVHVATCGAAAQYEASAGAGWTKNFARHLARGVFG
ncbi:MAG TPA: hypothetical protein VLI46_02755 [Ramlibacter sp.]|nr:hypothetical protein [Ramlibacter sp.]